MAGKQIRWETKILLDNQADILIGYSAFEYLEACYEYNENACYIADSAESLKAFLTEAMFDVADYRIDAVKFSDILADYGVSNGEYAMEAQALARFKEAAKSAGVKYSVERYETWPGQPDLFVVEIG